MLDCDRENDGAVSSCGIGRAVTLVIVQKQLADRPIRKTADRCSVAKTVNLHFKAFGGATIRTRSEYLAAALSRRQPWLSEGISRRTWERRRRKITAVTSAPAASPAAVLSAPAKRARPPVRRDLSANEGKSSKAPRAAVGLADHIGRVPAHKRALSRHAEDLLIHRIHDYWDARGMSPSDPQALANAIDVIELPDRLKHMERGALVKVYRRARGRLPEEYDRCVDLIAKWDKSYDRRKARDLVAHLITAVGDRPRGVLDRMFDHLEQQICDHLPKKVRRLELECERLKTSAP